MLWFTSSVRTGLIALSLEFLFWKVDVPELLLVEPVDEERDVDVANGWWPATPAPNARLACFKYTLSDMYMGPYFILYK